MKLNTLCVLPSSVILITCGVVLVVIQTKILGFVLVLHKNSQLFQLWQKKPMEIPVNYYFFNWTNPEDIFNQSSGVRPRFVELGPYKFRMKEDKGDIVWNDNGTVSYRQRKCFYFDSEAEESGNLDDVILSLNPTILAATYLTRFRSFMLRKSLSFSLSSVYPSIFTNQTVRKLLFDGFPDTMLQVANTFSYFTSDYTPSESGTFSWGGSKNCTLDYYGTFTMGTGINSTFGQLHSWNSWTQTPFYEGNCGKVESSAGEFFKQSLSDELIEFFSADLRRKVVLKYVGETMIHGIEGRRYVFEDHILDNGTIYPENRCYCNGECVPSGLFNVSASQRGAPVFASLPHFNRADPVYRSAVEGMNPDPDHHDFSVVVEPTTGIPLQISAKLQLNLLLQPLPSIALYEKVPRIFIPVLWSEQIATAPKGTASKLKLMIWLPSICNFGGSLLIFVGLVLLLRVVYRKYSVTSQEIKIKHGEEESHPLKTRTSRIVAEKKS